MPQELNPENEQALPGHVASTVGLGVCVLVRGVVVAWFADFDDAAGGWCTENHFGEWLTWRGAAPTPTPLTEAEAAEIERKAAELHAKLRIE
jgi:hypothetical protein